MRIATTARRGPGLPGRARRPNEVLLSVGKDEICADGVRHDPTTGGVAIEAKFIDNPSEIWKSE